MTDTPFRQAESVRVGTVDFVSPEHLKVALDLEAPESVALSAGRPRPFPRVNGYLLIPVDDSLLVGQVEWLTIERSAFPKRSGPQDFGLVDLPYPLRRLSLNPVGTLRQSPTTDSFEFRRGSGALPSVGAPVLLPSERQLRCVVESGKQRRVRIGTSRLAADAEVRVDPDRVFGRHLAVLGNTGSGKSCSVAGLIRWSLEESAATSAGHEPNARFIVLDPNVEYARAFGGSDLIRARIFTVNGGEGTTSLKVPLWLWNSAEWFAFTRATPRTQQPLLRRALREIKAGATAVGSRDPDQERKSALRRYLSSILVFVRNDLRSGAIRTDESKFGFRLRAVENDLLTKIPESPEYSLSTIKDRIADALSTTFHSFVNNNGETIEFYRAFREDHVTAILEAIQNVLDDIGGVTDALGPDEDAPIPFSGDALADHLEELASQENMSQYLDFLVARIRSHLSDPKMAGVVTSESEMTLSRWLQDYIGTDQASNGCVSVIDLSLVPTKVVHVVTAVVARMVFESLQRYLKVNGTSLPTVIVMEEAHTFVRKYREDSEDRDAAAICCQAFERIAREGRKFGLGLVLSSQRPSELSPTVLSQCNTFLLHRITNDSDQKLVHHFVPDNLRGLLGELPSLPSQTAILLGWAAELPILVKMDDLPREQQPQSDDPEFWDVWCGADELGRPVVRRIDWESIAAEWQGWHLDEATDGPEA
ncbi:MAG: ATP-binding protein [Acidobacteria bacterium]|nr:ATP-binding protein [Acidobacteriota bacterium]